ncbi:MAG: hypothetical protein CSA20_02835 [Deltaproteobacteria bacterium]|nr:MAG: hypothetical protein CSA20_02835 [Deltaproteobacteria bacterium]
MKRIDTHKSGQAGFALIEVIVCILIFSIGILAVARLGVESTRGDTMAGKLSEGAIAVQDQIERMLSMPYGDDMLKDKNGDGTTGLDKEGAEADHIRTTDDGVHVVSWNVADMIDPATGDSFNFKRIRVIVESNSPGGAKKTTYDYIRGQLTEGT